MVRAAATDDTNIIFGATIDERLTGQIWITVVATGLGGAQRRAAGSASGSSVLETPSFLTRLTDESGSLRARQASRA